MKIIVLGAGVIGVTTAWYLAKQGHEVTVLERLAGSALETSYANAGQVSYGYSSPWAAPGIPFKAMKWLFDEHPPLSIRPDGSVFQLAWMLQMWRNCTPARYSVNKERLLRISAYSRQCLTALREETGIEYDARQRGTLQLFRTQQQRDAAQQDMRALEQAGIAFQLLEADQLADAEPALAGSQATLVGGLRLPHDETGDCHLFTTRLTELAREQGVEFRYNTDVKRLIVTGGAATGVVADDARLDADAVVVALGAWSTRLLAPHLALPVYPLKGYSITAHITRDELAPQSTLLDETYKVAVTRLGSRIRVGGMAEIKGFDKSLDPRRQATLEMVLNNLFPGSHTPGDVAFWTGLRPKTPDSTPVIGPTKLQGLYLNTGHGTLGWTMACGSGRLLADIVSGQTPDIRSDDLGISRYA